MKPHIRYSPFYRQWCCRIRPRSADRAGWGYTPSDALREWISFNRPDDYAAHHPV